jgi:tRNA pseudouridine38-40 synthase
VTRFALTLEFDGTPFAGLQRQATAPTVQAAVENAVFAVTGEQVTLHAAGRTDTGVHALAMRAHVDVEKDIAPFRLMEALNAHLRPDPVAVIACEAVPEDWHARFSCTGRAYEYRIANRRAPLTLEKDRAWQIGPTLDAEAMNRAAQALVGKHDFTTFRSVQCQAASPVKTLDRLDVRRSRRAKLSASPGAQHGRLPRPRRHGPVEARADRGGAGGARPPATRPQRPAARPLFRARLLP